MYSSNQTDQRQKLALSHQDYSLCIFEPKTTDKLFESHYHLELTHYLNHKEAVLTSLSKHELCEFLLFIQAKITTFLNTYNNTTSPYLTDLQTFTDAIASELGKRIILDLLKKE